MSAAGSDGRDGGDAGTTDKKLLGRKTIARFREKFLFVILRIDGGPDGWMMGRGRDAGTREGRNCLDTERGRMYKSLIPK